MDCSWLSRRWGLDRRRCVEVFRNRVTGVAAASQKGEAEPASLKATAAAKQKWEVQKERLVFQCGDFDRVGRRKIRRCSNATVIDLDVRIGSDLAAIRLSSSGHLAIAAVDRDREDAFDSNEIVIGVVELQRLARKDFENGELRSSVTFREGSHRFWRSRGDVRGRRRSNLLSGDRKSKATEKKRDSGFFHRRKL
jgi:hypothetical protein